MNEKISKDPEESPEKSDFVQVPGLKMGGIFTLEELIEEMEEKEKVIEPDTEDNSYELIYQPGKPYPQFDIPYNT